MRAKGQVLQTSKWPVARPDPVVFAFMRDHGWPRLMSSQDLQKSGSDLAFAQDLTFCRADRSEGSINGSISGAHWQLCKWSEEKRRRFTGTLQSPLPDSNRRPPPYHFGPAATGGNRWQNEGLFERFLACKPSLRLRPVAPSFFQEFSI
jgi:hypothetical protein